MKKILIIGANSGIGSVIAQQLSLSGHTLIITGRNDLKLQTLKRKLPNPDRIYIYNIDVTNAEKSKEVYCEIKRKFKSIDWIIYAAGYIEKNEKATHLRNIFNINVFGMNDILSHFEKVISANGGVIAISSTAGIWGNQDYPFYSSSKAALNVLMSSIHKKWVPKKRYAFSICPGPTNTRMRKKIAKDSSEQQDPISIAEKIVAIIKFPNKFKERSIYAIRDTEFSKLNQELTICDFK